MLRRVETEAEDMPAVGRYLGADDQQQVAGVPLLRLGGERVVIGDQEEVQAGGPAFLHDACHVQRAVGMRRMYVDHAHYLGTAHALRRCGDCTDARKAAGRHPGYEPGSRHGNQDEQGTEWQRSPGHGASTKSVPLPFDSTRPGTLGITVRTGRSDGAKFPATAAGRRRPSGARCAPAGGLPRAPARSRSCLRGQGRTQLLRGARGWPARAPGRRAR